MTPKTPKTPQYNSTQRSAIERKLRVQERFMHRSEMRKAGCFKGEDKYRGTRRESGPCGDSLTAIRMKVAEYETLNGNIEWASKKRLAASAALEKGTIQSQRVTSIAVALDTLTARIAARIEAREPYEVELRKQAGRVLAYLDRTDKSAAKEMRLRWMGV